MPERDACFVVLGSSWFEILGGQAAPDLGYAEYRLRCRIVVDEPRSIEATILEVADASGVFHRQIPALTRQIPRDKIMREEPWVRGSDRPTQ